jgi:hypothetical protein
MGEYQIAAVIILQVSWEDQQRMRRVGQLDCGKRQYLSPLQLQNLPDETVNELFKENLVNQDSDLLEFGSAEFGAGDARQDAERAAEIICRSGKFEIVQIDRTIPCS